MDEITKEHTEVKNCAYVTLFALNIIEEDDKRLNLNELDSKIAP